ncbi:uncharacterized protein LOC106182054 isoform X2 [Lingula anatina]|uniref:Uncharacterized protein LOC106182054 isoform X2 n=1 Tax=Lingula anatina TaxID=7574 RepID=A0A1S3KIV2_LINAN|nr:uncharacterized protein LOC106182054 isoform X2 [Lingula anatina]XP_023932025.1 uncharacterized protein LOC106182054 isoform X2 [Lingula anatina]|eukprot:XP_013422136.2 uncharacterized protein LOC106182054 isoform X2 [Lingula anatina]
MKQLEKQIPDRIIRLCLSLWARSPKAYDTLKDSGFLILPSTRLLQMYKNSIPQTSGFQDAQFRWLHLEAQRLNVPSHGRRGGIIFDEMSIQEDLQMNRENDVHTSVGFVSISNESDYMQKLIHEKKEIKLADHALQMIFLGDTGFKFPIAHFSTINAATAPELYTVFWRAVSHLYCWDFIVDYACFDGAANNRSFLEMHFDGKSAKERQYRAKDPYDGNHEVVFIMDSKHSVKKIRNNLLKSKSTAGKGGKLLLHNGHPILWDHFVKAYEWDLQVNSMRIHHRLTQEHIYPDQAAKMRNKLAAEVLNDDMLHLMQAYSKVVPTDLRGTIALLEQTSKFISIIHDLRPIKDRGDERLATLRSVWDWFEKWVTNTNDQKHLFSHQTRDDLSSSILGFISYVDNKLLRFPSTYVVPARLNSDLVENFFSSQRAMCNGANANPTYLQYCKAVNTIIINQGAQSKKCNVQSCSKAGYSALPYKMHVKQPFRAKRPRLL